MIGKIFGTSKSIKIQIEFIKSLDIPEEDKVKLRLSLFEGYTSFKLAQRYLGLLIALTYVLMIVLTTAYHYIGLDYQGVISIVSAFEIGFVMLAVVGFYFSGGAIDSLRNR